MSLQVTDNPAASRFEIHRDGELVGHASYRRNGDVVVLPHTEVDRAVEGQGVGSALVRGTLDALREQGVRIVPACSFVARYVATHDEYADLVAR